jgi:hypothetical protein
VNRGREIEAALIVYADAPQAVEGRLANLRTLAGFSFLPRADETIEDIYFDTTDRSLQARLIALRVRKLSVQGRDDVLLLTMKADSQPALAGEDRVEIESSWSSSTLRNVVSELSNRGVRLPTPPDELGSTDPMAVMASLGLEEVQTRGTARKPRDVTSGAEAGLLAELAIDTVTYRFRDRPVSLLEVEVEAKGRGDASTVERITASLHDAFPSQLHPWPYGKLPTGKAIQELQADGQFDVLIDEDGMLRPAAYERIADFLNDGA